jgi:hypothetical protein
MFKEPHQHADSSSVAILRWIGVTDTFLLLLLPLLLMADV